MSDFTVIFGDRYHFGSHAGVFNDPAAYGTERIDGEIDFAGTERTFEFETPGADPNEPAVLLFQSFDVTVPFNTLEINGYALSGGIPTAAARGEWKSNAKVLAPGLLHADRSNSLTVTSSAAADPAGQNHDNFIVTDAIVMYKTR